MLGTLLRLRLRAADMHDVRLRQEMELVGRSLDIMRIRWRAAPGPVR